jgi:SAM-dependent methyltransferase
VLPFADNVFNLVLIESVLVFCQVPAVLSEIHRVLACGGKIAFNEFTYLKTPPQKLVSLVESKMGLHPFDEKGWEKNLINCGFHQVQTRIRRINFMTQLRNHLIVDGIKNYLGAIIAGISDTAIRRTFFTREMLSAARLFLPYIGYGLYTGYKQ